MKNIATEKMPRTMDNLGTWWSIALLTVGALIVAVFLYFDRSRTISNIIGSTGWLGVVAAIFIMAIICMTPIPSESITIMYLKAYGIGCGLFYSWIGFTLSSVAIFFIARSMGQSLLKILISQERFNQVNEWIKQKGMGGLLIARLLPIPAFVVNYVAGVIPSIRFWSYLWTASMAIIPYYLGTVLIFMGVNNNLTIWLVVGSLVMVLIWVFSYLLNHRQTV